MRRVTRRAGAVGVWSVVLASGLCLVSPAWSQAPPGVAGPPAARDPALATHLPWIFRERTQIVIDGEGGEALPSVDDAARWVVRPGVCRWGGGKFCRRVP